MTPQEKLWKLLVSNGIRVMLRNEIALILNEACRLGQQQGMEEAAKICDQQNEEPECYERAKYCAEAIRQAANALKEIK